RSELPGRAARRGHGGAASARPDPPARDPGGAGTAVDRDRARLRLPPPRAPEAAPFDRAPRELSVRPEDRPGSRPDRPPRVHPACVSQVLEGWHALPGAEPEL